MDRDGWATIAAVVKSLGWRKAKVDGVPCWQAPSATDRAFMANCFASLHAARPYSLLPVANWRARSCVKQLATEHPIDADGVIGDGQIGEESGGGCVENGHVFSARLVAESTS